MKTRSYHNFKYKPQKKVKIHFLSGYTAPVKKYVYHCSYCDSTIELQTFVTEDEMNKAMSDPMYKFPCLAKTAIAA